MIVEDIVMSRRSIRRFKQVSIESSVLDAVVKCGAFYPSRGNKQPLEFVVINEANLTNLIFDNIMWGSKVSGYKIFNDKRYAPTAYVVVLVDLGVMPVGYEYETGASVENMLLCATSYNLGSVWIKSINKTPISEYLRLPSSVILDSIIALGYPAHSSTVIKYENDTSTIIDKACNLYVPKKDFCKIIHYNGYRKS